MTDKELLEMYESRARFARAKMTSELQLIKHCRKLRIPLG